MSLPYPHIHVIINPSSGHDQAVLNTLNQVFHPAGVQWEVSLTHQAGDAYRLAQEAAASGVDLVAAYGGDGTQMEAANGLLGSDVPLAILPGGTGNVLARELHVPLELEAAARLILTSHRRRAIDLARIGDRTFALRAYVGVSERVAPERQRKRQLGELAYIESVLKYLPQAAPVEFRATIDGLVVAAPALVCFILNAGSVGGVLGLNLPPVGDVSISDGYLDLYLVTQNLKPLQALTHHLFHLGDWQGGVYYWRGQVITLEATSPKQVWIDGEPGGQTPFTARALPQAVEVVVEE